MGVTVEVEVGDIVIEADGARLRRQVGVSIVFTTNALELGLDIGGLDGVILAGFPSSTTSAWQQIGRAGRGWDKDARSVLPTSNPSRTTCRHLPTRPTARSPPLGRLVAGATSDDPPTVAGPCGRRRRHPGSTETRSCRGTICSGSSGSTARPRSASGPVRTTPGDLSVPRGPVAGASSIRPRRRIRGRRWPPRSWPRRRSRRRRAG